MSKKKKKRRSSGKKRTDIRRQNIKELTAVTVVVLVVVAFMAVSMGYDSLLSETYEQADKRTDEAVSETVPVGQTDVTPVDTEDGPVTDDTVFSPIQMQDGNGDDSDEEPDNAKETNISATENEDETGGEIGETDETDSVTESAEDNGNAPQITGVGKISVYLGESPAYLSGVSAADSDNNPVTVTYDPSAVDIYTPGTYSVQYFAVDESGNVGKEWGTVEVKSVDQETVDAIADEILAYILTDGMTEREKARAVYDWCVGSIIYSTRTSYLMGYNTDGAYAGLKNRRGNCFVYFSTAAELLSRAGIENIMIKRTNESNPHYWNLVKVDGEWYHFDSCPHFAEYPLTAFLLTDAEVGYYSETQAIGYYDFDAGLYPATP